MLGEGAFFRLTIEGAFLNIPPLNGRYAHYKEDRMAEETLVVVSKIKDYVKGKGFQTSETAVDALSNAVRELLDKATERAKSNGRQTIKDRDV